jgi:hypothetical protein
LNPTNKVTVPPSCKGIQSMEERQPSPTDEVPIDFVISVLQALSEMAESEGRPDRRSEVDPLAELDASPNSVDTGSDIAKWASSQVTSIAVKVGA